MLLSRRSLVKASLASAAVSFLPATHACAAAPDLAYVDPELRTGAAAMLAQMAKGPPLTLATLAESRKGKPVTPLAAPAVQKRSVPKAAGNPDVTIYIINARPGAQRPVIVNAHGGGFVLGDARGGIPGLQRVAAELNCVVVTVDYRLAPETNFAGSIEDNYAALRWTYRNAATLGADPKRIAVMGGSAGGGHAALLALTARDRGEVPLVAQVLIYPMLNDRTGMTRTPAAPIGTIVWTAEHNRFGWQSFLGQAPGTAQVPARAVPARYTDLRGLPPTFIGVGGLDLFVDEDIEYARRLVDVGVPTELVVVPGAFHGFEAIVPEAAVSRRFKASVTNALKTAFALPA